MPQRGQGREPTRSEPSGRAPPSGAERSGGRSGARWGELSTREAGGGTAGRRSPAETEAAVETALQEHYPHLYEVLSPDERQHIADVFTMHGLRETTGRELDAIEGRTEGGYFRLSEHDARVEELREKRTHMRRWLELEAPLPIDTERLLAPELTVRDEGEVGDLKVRLGRRAAEHPTVLVVRTDVDPVRDPHRILQLEWGEHAWELEHEGGKVEPRHLLRFQSFNLEYQAWLLERKIELLEQQEALIRELEAQRELQPAVEQGGLSVRVSRIQEDLVEGVGLLIELLAGAPGTEMKVKGTLRIPVYKALWVMGELELEVGRTTEGRYKTKARGTLGLSLGAPPKKGGGDAFVDLLSSFSMEAQAATGTRVMELVSLALEAEVRALEMEPPPLLAQIFLGTLPGGRHVLWLDDLRRAIRRTGGDPWGFTPWEWIADGIWGEGHMEEVMAGMEEGEQIETLDEARLAGEAEGGEGIAAKISGGLGLSRRRRIEGGDDGGVQLRDWVFAMDLSVALDSDFGVGPGSGAFDLKVPVGEDADGGSMKFAFQLLVDSSLLGGPAQHFGYSTLGDELRLFPSGGGALGVGGRFQRARDAAPAPQALHQPELTAEYVVKATEDVVRFVIPFLREFPELLPRPAQRLLGLGSFPERVEQVTERMVDLDSLVPVVHNAAWSVLHMLPGAKRGLKVEVSLDFDSQKWDFKVFDVEKLDPLKELGADPFAGLEVQRSRQILPWIDDDGT